MARSVSTSGCPSAEYKDWSVPVIGAMTSGINGSGSVEDSVLFSSDAESLSASDSMPGTVSAVLFCFCAAASSLFSASMNGRASGNIVAGRITLSSTVRLPSRVWLWVTKPMVRLRSRDSSLSLSSVTSRPSTCTVPELGRTNPATILIRVLLPLPERPTMATNSPASIVRST